MNPALHAPVGAPVELSGRLVVDVAGDHRRVRCESIAVFEDGKLAQRSKKLVVPPLSLVLEDGARVKLDLSNLKEHGIAPRRRAQGLWKVARAELELLSKDQAIRPEQRVELRIGQIEDGAKVRVRGIVAEHTLVQGGEQSAFRGAAASRAQTITVTHLAGGPDPERAMQSLLDGALDWAPSLVERPSRLWIPFLGASALALLASFARPNSVVWTADMVMTSMGLLAVAGVYLVERSHAVASQLAMRVGLEGGRDVRFNNAIATLFAVLASTSVAWVLVLDLVTSSARNTAFSAAGLLMTLGCIVAMAIVTARRASAFLSVVRRLLAPEKATDRTSGVIEGAIGDRTPVDSELGPAAVVALTVEEVVPGSDPNITSNSLEQKQDFFLRTADGEVAVDIDKARWASTVHLKIPASDAASDKIFHHKAFIPVGAKALAWGRVAVRAGRGSVLVDAPDNEQVLFVTAPNEEPRAVLRSLRRSIGVGFVLIALALSTGALFALSVWRYLPTMSSGD
ncbi:MAG: hypothetical protein U0269_13540 [Polyangiales bacterium]